jgi:hypothetical protein
MDKAYIYNKNSGEKPAQVQFGNFQDLWWDIEIDDGS